MFSLSLELQAEFNDISELILSLAKNLPVIDIDSSPPMRIEFSPAVNLPTNNSMAVSAIWKRVFPKKSFRFRVDTNAIRFSLEQVDPHTTYFTIGFNPVYKLAANQILRGVAEFYPDNKKKITEFIQQRNTMLIQGPEREKVILEIIYRWVNRTRGINSKYFNKRDFLNEEDKNTGVYLSDDEFDRALRAAGKKGVIVKINERWKPKSAP